MWPNQEFALAEVPRLLEEERRICLTSPTGSGKSRIMCGLIEQTVRCGCPAVLYTSRRLLIDQLTRVLASHGIEFGVRCAGHEDRRELPVQISSLPTEEARVYKKEDWQLHGNGKRVLALVDECHLNKG